VNDIEIHDQIKAGGGSRGDKASLVEVECTLRRANAHGRVDNSNITLPQRNHIQTCKLLGNSSLRGTELTRYIIVHAKMVLEMINTKSESRQDLKFVGRVSVPSSCQAKQVKPRVVSNSHTNLKREQKVLHRKN
jgi:hypothetical protein